MRVLVIFTLLLASCQSSPQNENQHGKAVIVPLQPTSQVKGLVTFTETPKGLHIHADIEGLPPGKHGFHIHEFGDVSDEGKAAGGHYNPNQTNHGLLVKDGFEGAHAGDLGNIEGDKEGKGTLDVTVPKLSLSCGPYPLAGRAVIIHEKEDDFSQPVGNAGSRIGGGPILIVR